MYIKDALYSNHSVVLADQGDSRIKEIMQGLHKMNFHGFLSIEPHLEKTLPGGGEERFVVAANAIKGILADLN